MKKSFFILFAVFTFSAIAQQKEEKKDQYIIYRLSDMEKVAAALGVRPYLEVKIEMNILEHGGKPYQPGDTLKQATDTIIFKSLKP